MKLGLGLGLGQSGAAPFTPASLGSAVVKGWWRGDSFANAGGVVTQLTDISGNAKHGVQADALKQGVYNATGLANQPTVLLDGSNDSYVATVQIAQPFHVFAVFKTVTWTINRRIWDGSVIDKAVMLMTPTTPRLAIFAGVGITAANADLAVGSFGVVSTLFSGASSYVKVGSAAAATGNPGTDGWGAGGVRIGANFNETNFGNIEIAEMLVTSSLTAAQVAQVQAYLGNRYGLAY